MDRVLDVPPSEMTAATDAPVDGPTAAVAPNSVSQPTKTTRTKSGLVKVGFYEVERTIGKGNYAVVKLGRHRVTKTEVRQQHRSFLCSSLLQSFVFLPSFLKLQSATFLGRNKNHRQDAFGQGQLGQDVPRNSSESRALHKLRFLV